MNQKALRGFLISFKDGSTNSLNYTLAFELPSDFACLISATASGLCLNLSDEVGERICTPSLFIINGI